MPAPIVGNGQARRPVPPGVLHRQLQRFQIEVTNNGTSAATNLRFEGQVPANLTLIGGIGIDFRRDGARIIVALTQRHTEKN